MNTQPPSPPVKLFLPPIEIGPSKLIKYSLVIIHSITGLSVISSALPLLFQCIVLTLLLVHGVWRYHCYRQFFKRHSLDCHYRLQYIEQVWYLAHYSHVHPPYVLGKTPRDGLKVIACHYCSAYLVLLRLIDPQGRQHYLNCAYDSCSSEDFRRLRVLAKFLM